MTIAEQRIAADVRAHLEWDSSVDHNQVRVDVDDGHVTLTGKVPTLSARDSATMDVLSLRGVRGVDNQLMVTHPEESDDAADATLAECTRLVLSWIPVLDGEQLRVSAHGRVVTLRGSVNAWWKRDIAEKAVANLRGVERIDNLLSVAPPYSHDDRQIAADIEAALARVAEPGTSDIDVAVRDGVATLSGSVPSVAAWEAAHRIAVHTSGVVSVDYQVEVRFR
jgi:osmotically-inducible protein OsmY